MNMQQIFILIAVVLALGASGWYFLNTNSGDSAMQEEGDTMEEAQNETNETVSDSFSGSGTLAELIARGNSYRCDFSSTQEGTVSEGDVYIDGGTGNYRMDAQYSQDGQSGSFSAIIDGQTMHWWGDTPEGRMGMRMQIPEGETMTAPPESFSSEATVSANEQVEYDCDPWRVDASRFVPPSDVEFTDMQQMMEEAMQGMPEGFEMPEGMQGQQ